MASIRISLIVVILFSAIPLYSQNNHLASEIEKLEKMALEPGQKTTAYSRLARLYQLSGDREKALVNWMAAAQADPARLYEPGIIEAAKLLISMGEFDRAAAELRGILISTNNPDSIQSAMNLFARLEAFKNGDYNPLALLAQTEPGFQSGTLYTLWRISGDDAYKNILLEYFPRSVEAVIASNNSGVNAAFTPQWLLLPSRN